MKRSTILQIIKEEVAKALNEKKSGEEQEYVYEYAYWVREDEYEFDTVGVYASNEKEARDKAYKEALKKHPRLLRSSKSDFILRSPKTSKEDKT